jgi:hypothetical protein
MANIVPVSFVGGTGGQWQVESITAITGDGLAPVEAVAIHDGHLAGVPAPAAWVLRGTNSHGRYVDRAQQTGLVAVQAPIGRRGSTCAALIPIRKSPAWWDLTQDERTAIFEGESRHISSSMKYLPAIARRLYQARDLAEPFDFLTWFDYAPEDAAAFDELVAMLRSTREWQFVDREVDVRLTRAS